MQLAVTINGTLLTTLLDSSSTHNFVDVVAASCTGIVLSGQAGLHVSMANGDWVHCSGSCHNMSMVIGNELFHLDYYGGAGSPLVGIQVSLILGQWVDPKLSKIN
jgi:hypothetical protein